MKHFKNILVIFDSKTDNRSLIDQAVDLAQSNRVAKKVVSVNEEGSFVVMGTVSRTGVAGLLIGNTAEKVFRKVNCSMLTVKPEGFISPMKQEPE